jgi:hypothetical protein
VASTKQGKGLKTVRGLSRQNGLEASFVCGCNVLKLQDQCAATTLPQTGTQCNSFFNGQSRQMVRVPQILTRLRQSLKFQVATANGAQEINGKNSHDSACTTGY